MIDEFTLAKKIKEAGKNNRKLDPETTVSRVLSDIQKGEYKGLKSAVIVLLTEDEEGCTSLHLYRSNLNFNEELGLYARAQLAMYTKDS